MLYYLIGGIFLGIWLGITVIRLVEKKSYAKSKQVATDKDNDVWANFHTNLIDGLTYFHKRYGNNIYIGSDLKGIGDVKVIYIMDTNTLAMLDTNTMTVIRTTELTKPVLVTEIISNIMWYHHININDFANAFGIKLDKKTFRESFKMDYEQFTTIMDTFQEMGKNETTTIEDYDESITYDIDDILDKISRAGLDSLSIDERDYLNKYSNGEEN